ncbi:class I SAM-dependent methyltransferase, partial [Vibrio parahaemolyticus]|uniref:class I SAM-dependent methyltransferase n=1 Tax=Vibrio parahaemolyticus TaxID=670 RepID=UPI000A84111A
HTIDSSGARAGQRILDLGGGTGGLTAKISRIECAQGRVVMADINNSLLNVGRDKLRDNGIVGNVQYVQANAEELPFTDDYFD